MIDTTKEEGVDGLRIYEVSYLLLPSIPEEKVASHVSAIKAIVSDAGGVFISEEDPKSRQLAYEMVKRIGTKNERFRSAYFGWLKFEVENSALATIKGKLDGTEAVLRSLIVKTVREDTYIPRQNTSREEHEAGEDSNSSDSEESSDIEKPSEE